MSDESYFLELYCDEMPLEDPKDIKDLKNLLKRLDPKLIQDKELDKLPLDKQQQELCKLVKKYRKVITRTKPIVTLLPRKSLQLVADKHVLNSKTDIMVDGKSYNIDDLYKEIKKDPGHFSPDQILRIHKLHDVLNNPNDHECHYYADYPEYCRAKTVDIGKEKKSECNYIEIFKTNDLFRQVISVLVDKFMDESSKYKCVVNIETITEIKKQCQDVSAKTLIKLLKDISLELYTTRFEYEVQHETSLRYFFQIKKMIKDLHINYSKSLESRFKEQLCQELAVFATPDSIFNPITKKYQSIVDDYNSLVKEYGVSRTILQQLLILLKAYGSMQLDPKFIKDVLRDFNINITRDQSKLIALVVNIMSICVEYTRSWSMGFILFPAGKTLLKKLVTSPSSLAGFFVMFELSLDNKGQQDTEFLLRNFTSTLHDLGIDIPTITEMIGSVNFEIDGPAKFWGAKLAALAVPKIADPVVSGIAIFVGNTIKSKIYDNIVNNLKHPKNIENTINKLDKNIMAIKKDGLVAIAE